MWNRHLQSLRNSKLFVEAGICEKLSDIPNILRFSRDTDFDPLPENIFGNFWLAECSQYLRM